MKTNLEIIEKYCEGMLSNAEALEFEKVLQSDNALTKELKNYLLVKSAINMASNVRLKKHLMESGNTTEYGLITRTRYIPYIIAAAGIAFIFGIGALLLQYFHHPGTTDDIFQSLYQRPEMNDLAERSFTYDTTLAHWSKAAYYYENLDFRKASEELVYLTNHPGTIPHTHTNYFLGICYMESNEFLKAIERFYQVGSEGRYAMQTQFFMALCYLKLNNKGQALVLLGDIKANPDHPNKKEARRMMRWME